jgi:hypothetical protein
MAVAVGRSATASRRSAETRPETGVGIDARPSWSRTTPQADVGPSWLSMDSMPVGKRVPRRRWRRAPGTPVAPCRAEIRRDPATPASPPTSPIQIQNRTRMNRSLTGAAQRVRVLRVFVRSVTGSSSHVPRCRPASHCRTASSPAHRTTPRHASRTAQRAIPTASTRWSRSSDARIPAARSATRAPRSEPLASTSPLRAHRTGVLDIIHRDRGRARVVERPPRDRRSPADPVRARGPDFAQRLRRRDPQRPVRGLLSRRRAAGPPSQ